MSHTIVREKVSLENMTFVTGQAPKVDMMELIFDEVYTEMSIRFEAIA